MSVTSHLLVDCLPVYLPVYLYLTGFEVCRVDSLLQDGRGRGGSLSQEDMKIGPLVETPTPRTLGVGVRERSEKTDKVIFHGSSGV